MHYFQESAAHQKQIIIIKAQMPLKQGPEKNVKSRGTSHAKLGILIKVSTSLARMVL